MRKEKPNNRIHSLEEQLRNSLSETTRESVSNHAFYSYRHANRLFKSWKGESIHSYVIKLRIQKATEYLIYTSNSVSDIAIDVGYESTAAFSKAFRKLMKQSPTAFRENNKVGSTLPIQSTLEKRYKIQYFNNIKLLTRKVPLSFDISEQSLFNAVKSSFSQLYCDATHLCLLWDEDPVLSQVLESRFFLGIDPNDVSDQIQDLSSVNITGRYAIFDAQFFQNQPYKDWHHIAYLVLDLEGVSLREGLYIEWFSTSILDSTIPFAPGKIAIPVL